MRKFPTNVPPKAFKMGPCKPTGDGEPMPITKGVDRQGNEGWGQEDGDALCHMSAEAEMAGAIEHMKCRGIEIW